MTDRVKRMKESLKISKYPLCIEYFKLANESLDVTGGEPTLLRRAKLQFASFPLDWIALGSPVSRAKLVAARFDGWLNKEDFKYELAVITVAASLKEGDKTKTTRGNFNKNINEVIEKNEKFNYMMNNNSSETLFRHAMEDKGQKLYNDYQVCADKLKKLNEQKEEFKQEKKKQVIKSKDDMKLSANDTIKRSKTFSKKP